MARFGRFELLTRLGQGGMAEVYLARAMLAEGLFKLVALKRIHAALSEDPQFARMFVEEAKVAAELNHPNIVQVFDFGKLDNTYYLAMEYVEGLDLARLLRKHAKRIPPPLAALIVQNVAAGLDYAHRKTDIYGRPLEIVHRDVSPQNVLVSYDGAVKIADFGIAKARGTEEEQGVVKGKFAYMAPEQALGQEVDRRADIYSAGVVLYELLAGKAPFGGLKGKEALEAVRRAEIPPLREAAPEAPEDLERIVMRCLARDPAQRYQRASELREALARYLAARTVQDGTTYDAVALSRFLDEVVPPERRLDPRKLVVASSSVPGGPEGTASVVLSRVATVTPVQAVEKKRVVVVYADYVASDTMVSHHAELWKRAKEKLWKRAGDLAYKWEVKLRQADDGGICFVVGVPLAGEDDASRAIHLANVLLETMGQIREEVGGGLDLKVGLVRGEAEVRRGDHGAFQYRLLGSAAAVARKVAENAEPGQVVAGAGVYQSAKTAWTFDPAGEVILTGQAEGSRSTRVVQLYRLLGPKPRDTRRSPMLRQGLAGGRDLELEELKKAYRDVLLAGRPRALALVGEAGLGKRSLVEMFCREAQPRPTRILRASGRQWSQNLPFALMTDLVQDLLELGEEQLSDQEVERRIQELLGRLWHHEGEDVRSHAKVLNLLVRGPAAVEAELPPDAELRHKMVGRTLHLILSKMAHRGSLIVVLDEFHWADSGSRVLLHRFLESPPEAPILLIVTTRPPEGADRILEHPLVDVIELHELDKETARRLVVSRFENPEDAAPLIDEVLAKGGGNPYYLLAILDHLVDRGICERKGDPGSGVLVWKERQAAVQIPATVEELVAARLDRLDPQVKTVLRWASVFGRFFTKQDLEALAGRSVDTALKQLEDRGLVELEGAEGSEFRFASQVVADVAYEGLAAAEARRLHERAARILSAKGGGPGGDAKVAMHLARAGKTAEAGRLYAKAGLEARKYNANREAFGFLTLALKYGAGDKKLEFHVRLAREDVLARWGRRQEQLEELRRLDELAETPEERALVAARWMNYYQATSQPKRVIQKFEDCWKDVELAGHCERQAEFYYYKSRALTEIGENRKALEAIAEARSLCSQSTWNSRVWGELTRVEGNAYFYLGEYVKAATAYKSALEIFRKLGLRLNEAVILNNLGFMYYSVGEFEAAIRHLKAAYEIYRQYGDRSSIASTLSNLGQVYAAIGIQDKGLTYLRKAEEHCRIIEDASFRADALVSIGQVYLAQDKLEEGVAVLRQGLESAIRAESTYDVVRAEIYMALALSRPGPTRDLDTARQLAEDAVAQSRKARMPQGEVFGLMALAAVQEALGDLDAALGTSTQAVARLATAKNVAESEVIFHRHAKLLLAAGRDEEALPYLDKAYQAVQIKARKLTDPAYRQSYLSVPPARDIVSDYETYLAGVRADV